MRGAALFAASLFRVGPKEVLTGASATVVVRLYGPDLAVLRARAKEAAALMEKIPGVTNLKVEPRILVPQVTVRLKLEAAAQFGLTAGHVRRAAATLVQSKKVGEVYRDQKSFDVTVWGSDSIRTDVQTLSELLIDTPNGATVPLQDVAEIAIAPAPNEIKHEGASRRLDVTCDTTGHDLGNVAREIQQQVATLSFPAGYYPKFLGEYAARQESQRRLMLLSDLLSAGDPGAPARRVSVVAIDPFDFSEIHFQSEDRSHEQRQAAKEEFLRVHFKK